jgi:hypothetical protein
MVSRAAEPLILLTDATPPVLTDTIILSGTSR